MNDRVFLWLAQAFYAVSGALTFLRLRRNDATAVQRLNYATMLCGFALHTAFMFLRGQHIRRCPLTNPFETTVFIAWAAVLFYLLIGPSYRVSFLGAFTAPVVVGICIIALLGLDDAPPTRPTAQNPWVDFHAATAIMAYGAFALAFVTGAMYLRQERQLKTRNLSRSFLLLPSIEQLDVINFRLLVLGFVMLTIGMIGGFVSYRVVGPWPTPKVIWAVGAWLIYASLLGARLIWSLHGRKIALGSMVSFMLVLVTFWTVSLR
jgi:HemX protein